MIAADLLARAFHLDPLMLYAFGSTNNRPARLRWLFVRALRASHRLGKVTEHHSGSDLVAVALWLPARQIPLPTTTAISFGLLLAPFFLSFKSTFRLLRHEEPCERLIAKIAPEDASYLWIVGVDPQKNGNGFGSVIVKQVLADMVRQGFTACFLKTECKANIGFYERFGFEVVAVVDNAAANLRSWVAKKDLAD
jgi:ribosomal protein S18 acetylase RimI-like enzyme